jgi:hypothetical protein
MYASNVFFDDRDLSRLLSGNNYDVTWKGDEYVFTISYSSFQDLLDFLEDFYNLIHVNGKNVVDANVLDNFFCELTNRLFGDEIYKIDEDSGEIIGRGNPIYGENNISLENEISQEEEFEDMYDEKYNEFLKYINLRNKEIGLPEVKLW